MDKKPRHNKSKNEILKDIENQTKQHKLRKFVREQFFPILCEATDSINDADIFLQTFSTMLMDTFLNLMKEKKFKEFNIITKLDPKSTKFAAIEKMVKLFDDMTVREAQDMIEGMKQELRYFYRKEMETRKLSELKVNFLE